MIHTTERIGLRVEGWGWVEREARKMQEVPPVSKRANSPATYLFEHGLENVSDAASWEVVDQMLWQTHKRGHMQAEATTRNLATTARVPVSHERAHLGARAHAVMYARARARGNLQLQSA